MKNKKGLLGNWEVKSIHTTGVENSKGEMVKANIPWSFIRIRDGKWFFVDGEGNETPCLNA